MKPLRQIVPLNEFHIPIVGGTIAALRYREASFRKWAGASSAKRNFKTAIGLNWLQRNFSPNRLAMKAKKNLGYYGSPMMTRLRQAAKGNPFPDLPGQVGGGSQSTPVGGGKLRTMKTKLSTGRARKLGKAPVLGESSADLEKLIGGHPMSGTTPGSREHFIHHAEQYSHHFYATFPQGQHIANPDYHKQKQVEHWQEIVKHHTWAVHPKIHDEILDLDNYENHGELYDHEAKK